MSTVLLRTKLFIPRARVDVVPRRHLVALLNDGLWAGDPAVPKIALLSAPAGFGKTSLLAEWIPQSKCCVTWLSLDEGDNDPVRFWSYLIAALQMLQPQLGEQALALLHSQGNQAPPVEAALTLLVNDVAAFPDSFALVLDDYHAITAQAVHHSLSFLIEHLPPQMRLVITTRSDPPFPLSRWRAGGWLIELRAADLRFTPDEASALLADVAGLPLTPAQVASLQTRTEGWIAGLQLALLSMRGRTRPDLTTFVEAFTGSHRFVLDYLTEQVLLRQPAEVRSFLLRTSVLDQMCASLCEALLGKGDWQAVLEHLERNNVFVTPLDDQRIWYRYHYLFADLLRARLTQAGAQLDAPADLHRRASQWFEQNDLAAEAVQHAFRASDFDRAADLLESHVDPMLKKGELAAIQGWLEALPDSILHTRPYLLLVLAWLKFLLSGSYGYEDVESLLQLAEAVLSSSDTPASKEKRTLCRGIVTTIRACIAASGQPDLARAIALSRQALDQLPESIADRRYWRVVSIINLGISHLKEGNLKAAGQTLAAAVDLCTALREHYVTLVALRSLAIVYAMQGKHHKAAETLQHGLALAAREQGRDWPVMGFLHVDLGKLLYVRDDLQGAALQLSEGLALARLHNQIWQLLDGTIYLALVKLAQGDWAESRQLMDQVERLSQTAPGPDVVQIVRAINARMALVRDDTVTAARWLQETRLSATDSPDYAHELEYLTLARVLRVCGRASESLPLLEHMAQAAEASGRVRSLIEVRTLEALAMQACGDVSAALEKLQQALTLAEPEAPTRMFVNEGKDMQSLLLDLRSRMVGNFTAAELPPIAAYLGKLLGAFPDRVPPDQAPPGIVEPPRRPESEVDTLGERELEVLRLIAAGASNKEIAQTLFIAVSTVKKHINNIYGKLSVTSRTRAVARARELKLIQ